MRKGFAADFGYQPSRLYASFGSKEELFLTTLDKYEEETGVSQPPKWAAIERPLLRSTTRSIRMLWPRTVLYANSGPPQSTPKRVVRTAAGRRAPLPVPLYPTFPDSI